MKLWLDPSTDAETALQLFGNPDFDWFRVSSAVNNVREHGSVCVEPVDLADNGEISTSSASVDSKKGGKHVVASSDGKTQASLLDFVKRTPKKRHGDDPDPKVSPKVKKDDPDPEVSPKVKKVDPDPEVSPKVKKDVE